VEEDFGSDSCARTSFATVKYPTMEVTHSRLLLAEEQRMIDIEMPHHHDVLCGRGVTTNRHPGNESFRSLVSLNKVSMSRFHIPVIYVHLRTKFKVLKGIFALRTIFEIFIRLFF
jgi:N-dimethylarginine dimethylaminohydrolase